MSTTADATPATTSPATATTLTTDAPVKRNVVHREDKAGLTFSVASCESVVRAVLAEYDAAAAASASSEAKTEGDEKKATKTKLSSTASVATAFVGESMLRSLITMSATQTGTRQTLHVRDLVSALTNPDGNSVYAMLAQQIPLSILTDDEVAKPVTKRRRKKTDAAADKEGDKADAAEESKTESGDAAPVSKTADQKLAQHVKALYVSCFGLAEGKTEASLPHGWMPGVKNAGVKEDGTSHRMTGAFRETLIYLLACYLHRLAQNALVVIHTSAHSTVSHKHILAAASTAMPASEVSAFMAIATEKVQTFLDNTVNKDKDDSGTVVTTTTATTSAV